MDWVKTASQIEASFKKETKNKSSIISKSTFLFKPRREILHFYNKMTLLRLFHLIFTQLTRQFGTLIALVLSPWIPHAAAAVLLIGQHRQRHAVALETTQNRQTAPKKWSRVERKCDSVGVCGVRELTTCLGVVSWKQRPLGLCLEGIWWGHALWGGLTSDSGGWMTTEVPGVWWTRKLICTEKRKRKSTMMTLHSGQPVCGWVWKGSPKQSPVGLI